MPPGNPCTQIHATTTYCSNQSWNQKATSFTLKARWSKTGFRNVRSSSLGIAECSTLPKGSATRLWMCRWQINRSPKVWVDAIIPSRKRLSGNTTPYSSRIVADLQRASSASNRPAYRVEEIGKLLFLAARMELVINFFHLALGQMGIDFGSGDG